MHPEERRTTCPSCSNNIAYAATYEGQQMQCPHCSSALLLTSQVVPPPYRPTDSSFPSPHGPAWGVQSTGQGLTQSLQAFKNLPWYQKEMSINLLIILGILCFPPALWAALIIVITGSVYKKPNLKRPKLEPFGIAHKIGCFLLLIAQLGLLLHQLDNVKRMLGSAANNPKQPLQSNFNTHNPAVKHEHGETSVSGYGGVLNQYRGKLLNKIRGEVDGYMEIQPAKISDNGYDLFYKISIKDSLTGIEYNHLHVQMGGANNTCDWVNIGKSHPTEAQSTRYDDLKLTKVSELNVRTKLLVGLTGKSLREITDANGKPDLVREGGSKLFYRQKFRAETVFNEERVYRCIQIDLDSQGIFKELKFLEQDL